MPAETHQMGYYIDTGCVLALVQALLGSSEEDESGDSSLAELGIDDYRSVGSVERGL